MRRRLVAVLALAVVLAAAGWLGARALLDVDRHRGAIVSLLADTTGWRAEVGPLSLGLAPGAAIRGDRPVLRDPRGVSELRASDLVVRARLGPLFGRRLEARELLFLRPTLRLGRAPDGQLVLPPLAAVARGAAGLGQARLVEIRLRGGRVEIPPPPGGTGAALGLEDLEAVFVPATGRLWGRARIAGKGTVSWLGTAGGRLEIRAEALPLAPVLARAGLGAAGIRGRFDGTVVREGGGALAVEGALADLAGPGDRGWPEVRVDVRIEPPGAGRLPLAGTLAAGPLVVEVSGHVGRDPRLSLAVHDAPAADLLAALGGLVDLPFAAAGGGALTGSADLRAGADPLAVRWELAGALDRVELSGGPTIRAARVEASSAGGGVVTGTVSGNLLGGTLRVAFESAADGATAWRGSLAGADAAALLRAVTGGGAGDAALAGAARLDGQARVTVDGAVGGRIDVRIDPFEAPGWDLLAPWVAALAEREAEAPRGAESVPDPLEPPPPARPRAVAARVALRGGSIMLDDVTISAPGVAARGSGRLERRPDGLVLRLSLDPDAEVRGWLAGRLARLWPAGPPSPDDHQLAVTGSPAAPAFRLDPPLPPVPPPPAPEPGPAGDDGERP